jgi:hypothetical protein
MDPNLSYFVQNLRTKIKNSDFELFDKCQTGAEYVEFILNVRPDILKIGDSYNYEIEYIIRGDYDDVIKCILTMNDVNAGCGILLCLACMYSKTDLVEKLISMGADVNVDRTNSFHPSKFLIILPPLCCAIEYNVGNTKLCQILLSNGADPNILDGKPLKIAIYHHDIKIINLLLRYGANPSNVFPYYGNKEIFYLLVKAGTDINHCKSGVIKNAIYRNELDIVQFVLNSGYDMIECRDSHIFDVCIECNNLEAIRMILNHGYRITVDDFKESLPKITSQMLHFITDIGFDITQDHNYALKYFILKLLPHLPIEMENDHLKELKSIITILIKNGAYINENCYFVIDWEPDEINTEIIHLLDLGGFYMRPQ